MAAYLGRVVPNMAVLLQSLPSMSSKQESVCEAAQDASFAKWEKQFLSSLVLAAYSNSRQARIRADALSYSFRVDSCQKGEDGPFAFAVIPMHPQY